MSSIASVVYPTLLSSSSLSATCRRSSSNSFLVGVGWVTFASVLYLLQSSDSLSCSRSGGRAHGAVVWGWVVFWFVWVHCCCCLFGGVVRNRKGLILFLMIFHNGVGLLAFFAHLRFGCWQVLRDSGSVFLAWSVLSICQLSGIGVRFLRFFMGVRVGVFCIFFTLFWSPFAEAHPFVSLLSMCK